MVRNKETKITNTEHEALIKALKKPNYNQMYEIVNNPDFAVTEDNFAKHNWTYAEFVRIHQQNQSQSLVSLRQRILKTIETINKSSQ